MKKIIFILLPVFSFAQQKDTMKLNSLNRSLDYELKESLFKKDTIGSFKLDVEKYKLDALRERKNESLKYTDEQFRRENLRNDLLKHGSQRGKSDLKL